MNTSFKALSFALAAAALLAGCAGQTTATTPQITALSNATHGAVRQTNGGLQFQVYTAGQTPGFPITAGAFDLAPGLNQTMWFTDPGTPAIGRIASDGTFTEFTNGLQTNAEPYAIVPGPDGNMWFTDYNGVTIGKVTPDGTITEYKNAKFTDTNAKGIAFGPDGRPWIVGFGLPAVLAHLDSRGRIGTHPLPYGFTPDGSLAADAGGNLWFTGTDRHEHAQLLERVASSGKIVRLAVHEVAARLPCCPNTAAKSMVIGSNGAPWFTTLYDLKRGSTAFHVGTVANGQVQLLRLTHAGLTSSAYPSGIGAGSSGLWITGGNPLQNKGALWHFNAKRNQKAYPLSYDPISLTVDASGNPWFTASFSGSASQIVEVLGGAGH